MLHYSITSAKRVGLSDNYELRIHDRERIISSHLYYYLVWVIGVQIPEVCVQAKP